MAAVVADAAGEIRVRAWAEGIPPVETLIRGC